MNCLFNASIKDGMVPSNSIDSEKEKAGEKNVSSKWLSRNLATFY